VLSRRTVRKHPSRARRDWWPAWVLGERVADIPGSDSSPGASVRIESRTCPRSNEDAVRGFVRPLRFPIALVASIAVLTACGGGGSPSTLPSATPPTSSPTSFLATAFHSTRYGYSLTSTAWTGTEATTTWDGTGSPGDADPTVDTLLGPEGQRAFAYGEPTKLALSSLVEALRKTDATIHPCPITPEATSSPTIGGEPAIVDEEHCPAAGGPFVITAYVIHAGRAYIFFTYSIPPGTEDFTRAWFEPLLRLISLGS
jgi:hypothetical protein